MAVRGAAFSVKSASAAPVHGFPSRVGRYELLLPIGDGATATVYLARTRVVGELHRDVAIKLVHPHLREELGTHLIDEARIAAAIRHPHVVGVIEADEGPHGAYLVLDYVEGETLAYLARRAPEGRLPLPIVGRVLGDVLDGLHAAHEHRDERGEPTQLVHRDLSLRNVLVGTDGKARLTDFGIAKIDNSAPRTRTGQAKGTIPYMSPEQAAGKPLDRRSDVWAIGVVAWELLTGRRLFDQDSDATALLEIVGHKPVPPPSSVRRQLPAEIDEALRSALERDPDRRCPDALELRRRLVGALEEVAEVATHAEVGALVSRLVEETLSERKRSVEAVLAARVSAARAAASAPLTSPAGSAQPGRSRAWLWVVPALATIAVSASVASRWPAAPSAVELRRAGIEVPSVEITRSAPPESSAMPPESSAALPAATAKPTAQRRARPGRGSFPYK